MFQQTSHFQTNSRFETMVSAHRRIDPPRVGSKLASKTQEIDNKTLEDWSYRIEQCAYEAEDEQLLVLYSDLLDLRDDIVHHLHKNV